MSQFFGVNEPVRNGVRVGFAHMVVAAALHTQSFQLHDHNMPFVTRSPHGQKTGLPSAKAGIVRTKQKVSQSLKRLFLLDLLLFYPVSISLPPFSPSRFFLFFIFFYNSFSSFGVRLLLAKGCRSN
jgi:hypothetical protein